MIDKTVNKECLKLTHPSTVNTIYFKYVNTINSNDHSESSHYMAMINFVISFLKIQTDHPNRASKYWLDWNWTDRFVRTPAAWLWMGLSYRYQHFEHSTIEIFLVEIYGRMENSKFDLLKSNCCIIGFERLVDRVSIVDRGSFFFDIFP